MKSAERPGVDLYRISTNIAVKASLVLHALLHIHVAVDQCVRVSLILSPLNRMRRTCPRGIFRCTAPSPGPQLWELVASVGRVDQPIYVDHQESRLTI